ncbi:hypothetical protein G8C93_00750 [Cellulosimicrobium cellulans]|uniref:hypothetical protein n=1 Tax=Cellulosimicrobium cellulans TaxID=1710 RepID=UPI001883F949|nr:hypothetical protein [Cellulosimicrobium cellulans]MBE9924420.1 hypothetical protein [Cellulosimicrobium cellulans]
MPAPDPTQGVPLPTYDDAPAIPDHLRALFEALMARAVPRFINTAARDAAYPAPADGQMCITGTAPTIRSWLGQGGQWTETFPLYGAWQKITPAPSWEGFGGDQWWVRQEGEWGATNNILLRRTAGQSLTMTAGQSYGISSTAAGGMPANVLPVEGIRGPYVIVKIRGNVDTDGLLYWNATPAQFHVIPSATVTLTGGSTSQYVAIGALRWLLKVPA